MGRPVANPTWVDKANGWVIRSVAEHDAPTLPASTRSALDAPPERTRSVLNGFLPPGR